jgi:DNA (cytosine-5)-methyltransferase 1
VPRFTLIDLFAGCGGLTRGFEESHLFRSVFAVESDRDAAETWRQNFGVRVFMGRVEKVEAYPQADVIVGGPPCQGFSPLNMRGVGLERRGLWREYLRALEEAKPRAFLMENVPELLRSAEYQAFAEAAEALGFHVEGRLLNAADYGVPQTRKRAIVTGSRLGAPPWPEQSHFPPTEVPANGSAWLTVRDAIADLPRTPTGKDWHNPRNPRPTSVERYRTIPKEGEGRFELAARRPDITPACWLRKKTGSTDVFGRLWWDRPGYTIRTEFYKPEKGRYLHPSEHRPITVREAARLMGFPDDFILPTDQSMTSVAKQIGNAVPPPLALRLAETLADHLAASSVQGAEVAAAA